MYVCKYIYLFLICLIKSAMYLVSIKNVCFLGFFPGPVLESISRSVGKNEEEEGGAAA